MRNFLDAGRGRRRERSSRFRSRYARGRTSGQGGQKLIRYRRNRELMAREIVLVALWFAIGLMLVSLTQTFWRVGEAHLSDKGALVRLGLPALSAVACLGCLWRARRNFKEFLDIRREQRRLEAELREDPETERLEA